MDGNRDLFWRLVEPEHLRARAFCRKLMGEREEGDDLYQDCLVTALVRLADLRDERSFRPWLYRIIVNGFKNRVRTGWFRRRVTLTPELQDGIGSEDPTDRYAARRRLDRSLKVLSADERSLITLYELQGWSVVELTDLFGKKEGNIKVRLSRIRRKMRRALARQLPSREKQRQLKASKVKDRICVATKPGEN